MNLINNSMNLINNSMNLINNSMNLIKKKKKKKNFFNFFSSSAFPNPLVIKFIKAKRKLKKPEVIWSH